MFYVNTSLLGDFLLHLKQLEHAVSADGRSGIMRHHKQVYQADKQALKNSKKYALNRAEVLRLMGRYFWLIGNQKEAVSLWTQSMIAAEHLGARVDLAKVYMEIGSRFLESRSNYLELNCINADEYLFKAKSLFKEIGIMSDLAELEIIAPDR